MTTEPLPPLTCYACGTRYDRVEPRCAGCGRRTPDAVYGEAERRGVPTVARERATFAQPLHGQPQRVTCPSASCPLAVQAERSPV